MKITSIKKKTTIQLQTMVIEAKKLSRSKYNQIKLEDNPPVNIHLEWEGGERLGYVKEKHKWVVIFYNSIDELRKAVVPSKMITVNNSPEEFYEKYPNFRKRRDNARIYLAETTAMQIFI